MNLLKDKWIKVIRKDGSLDEIVPFEITAQFQENPIVDVVTPRADFRGAIYQFFIGLFQTVYCPNDDQDWQDKFNTPPTPGDLKQETDKVAFAFELFGRQHRFMQDISLAKNQNEKKISQLFIESPGDNTLIQNRDHFIKRNTINTICPKCAALALFTLQTNAPSGGQGHLTSIRGGGPLTTLLKYIPKTDFPTLWQDIWLNILPKNSFNIGKGVVGQNYEFVFPWQTKDFYKVNKNGNTTTQDLHPFAVYWSNSRRIFLQEVQQSANCDICNEHSQIQIKNYFTGPQGIDYSGGGWIHPLSPYYIDKNQPLVYHPQPGGILYDNWLAFVYTRSTQSQNAKVIQEFLQARSVPDEQTQIWTFGYDMDKMKARAWYESLIPIYRIDSNYIQTYEAILSSILTVASEVAKNLEKKVKQAWFDKPIGDVSYLKINFFKLTQNEFYSLAKSIRDNLSSQNPFDDPSKEKWLKYLNTKALELFDLYVESGAIEFEDVKRIVKARNSLIGENLGSSMKKIIGLPQDGTTTKVKSKKRSSN